MLMMGGVSLVVIALIVSRKSSLVHYIRFLPSPEGDAPLSMVIATLLLTAAVIGYLVVLWVFRSIVIKKRH